MKKPGSKADGKPKMRAYKFQPVTIEALEALTKEVNKKLNIRVSATAILELLIMDATKEGASKIVRLIKIND